MARQNPPLAAGGHGGQGRQPFHPDLNAPAVDPQGGPPCDREAEEAVAGALLFFGEETGERVFSQLCPADFYLDRCCQVFEAALRVAAAGDTPSLLTIRDALAATGRLDEGWHSWALGTEAALIGPAFLDRHIKKLKAVRLRRDLRRVLLEATQLCGEADPVVLRDDLRKRLEELGGGDSRQRLPVAEDAASFLGRKLPEQMFLIEPCLLPRGGKGFVGGAPKLGKTLLALHIAVALSSGRSVLSLFETRPARVLYVNFEVAEAPFQDRLAQIADSFALSAAERQEALSRLFVVSPGPVALNSQTGFFWLRDQIRRCEPGLVILDPLVKAHNLDENSAGDMQRLLSDLDRLTRETGVGWLIVHHFHKPSALAGHRTGGQLLRGSSVLFGDVDVVFALTPEDKPPEDGPPATILEVTSRYGLPLDPIPMRLEDTLTWSLLARRGRPKVKGPAAAVEVLREQGSLNYEALLRAVMEQAGVSETTAKRYVREAISKGVILCSTGIYHL